MVVAGNMAHPTEGQKFDVDTASGSSALFIPVAQFLTGGYIRDIELFDRRYP